MLYSGTFILCSICFLCSVHFQLEEADQMWNQDNGCSGVFSSGDPPGSAAGTSCLVLAKLSMELLLGRAALDRLM